MMQAIENIKFGYGKKKLNLLILGHVNAGKSTSYGHMIYKCGSLTEIEIEMLEKERIEYGKSSNKYAWVMDKVKAALETGRAIDCSL